MEEIKEEALENSEKKESGAFDIHDQKFQWFTIICQSGMEKRAKDTLLERIEKLGVAEKFGQIIIPVKKQAYIDANGKKKEKEIKKLPGYMLVQMQLDNKTFDIVKNVPRISGFLGGGTNKLPPPVPSFEIERLLNDAPTLQAETIEVRATYEVGDRVKVNDGPFTGFIGEIDDVKQEKKKLRLLISVFGRPTPVELEFHMVEKVTDEN